MSTEFFKCFGSFANARSLRWDEIIYTFPQKPSFYLIIPPESFFIEFNILDHDKN